MSLEAFEGGKKYCQMSCQRASKNENISLLTPSSGLIFYANLSIYAAFDRPLPFNRKGVG